MQDILRPTSFQPLSLTMLNVGPIRELTTIDFVGQQGISNLFLLMGPNGSGKSTALEAIYCALGALAPEPVTPSFPEIEDGTGGIQFDARIILDDGIKAKPFVLSIAIGALGLLKPWTEESAAAVEADQQIVLNIQRGIPGVGRRSFSGDREALSFAAFIQQQTPEAPLDVFDDSLGLPTVLYFTADRAMIKPAGRRSIVSPKNYGFRPAHRFGIDGQEWDNSIDNLFVWYAWLNDGREERCRSMVNDLLFKDGKRRLGEVNRQEFFVPVVVESVEGSSEHHVDQLSHGERQLLQFIVRTASHMTGSTIVLVDEAELHLHTTFCARLMAILKDWIRLYPGLTVIMTSHQTELVRLMAPKEQEHSIRKGGALVKPRYYKAAR